jgi:hypothetical protein
MKQFPSENGDPLLPDFPSESGEPEADLIYRTVYIYYLAPEYITNDIHSLHVSDLELFELAIIHHENVKKLNPRAFMLEFNASYISDEGYIVIK